MLLFDNPDQLKCIFWNNIYSCPQVFYQKTNRKRFAKFSGKHLQSLFLNKITGCRTTTRLKRDSSTGVTLWNFRKFSKQAFYRNLWVVAFETKSFDKKGNEKDHHRHLLTVNPAQYGVRLTCILAFDASTNEHIVTIIPNNSSIMPNTKAPVACPLDICLPVILLNYTQLVCALRNFFSPLFSCCSSFCKLFN